MKTAVRLGTLGCRNCFCVTSGSCSLVFWEELFLPWAGQPPWLFSWPKLRRHDPCSSNPFHPERVSNGPDYRSGRNRSRFDGTPHDGQQKERHHSAPRPFFCHDLAPFSKNAKRSCLVFLLYHTICLFASFILSSQSPYNSSIC